MEGLLMKRYTISISAMFLLSLLFGIPCMADGPADCMNIQTDKGTVSGVSNKGVCEYKGVPFAAPPVGELRFRLPQAAEPWSETLVADTFGSDCYQTAMVDLFNSAFRLFIDQLPNKV